MSSERYEDILFEKDGEIRWIKLNREAKGNTFRLQTVREMIDALEDARRDVEARAVVITGVGNRFFCLGGDHEGHDDQAPIHYVHAFPVVDLYDLIDKHPVPVIAMVNGFAVGGGNVLAMVCDLTIAATTAVFRQVGPMMGSFDAGFGTWLLEQTVGRKRAKEFWYLNKKYTADDAYEMGLVNEVVVPDQLEQRVRDVCAELAHRGPMALAALKASFYAMHAGAPGLSRVALDLLTHHYYGTAESHELGRAFAEKRAPDKTKFYR
jgi:naphthoate synthase